MANAPLSPRIGPPAMGAEARTTTAVILGLLLLSLFFGLAAAVVAPIAAMLMVAAAGALAVLFMPLSWALVLELVLAAVVAGSVQYFVGISQAMWVPYLLGLMLAMRALIEQHTHRPGGPSSSNPHMRMPPLFVWLLVLYLTCLLISYVINRPSMGEILVSAKNYLFMWGVLIAFLALRSFWPAVQRVWKALVVIACVQLPVVLYQKFFIASGLSNAGGAAGLSWDAVNGTFGGSLMGGQSSVMAIFIVLALSYALVRWREGQLKTSRLFLLLLATLPSLVMAEVKAAVVWLAIAGAAVFSREVVRRPALALSGLVGAVVLAGGIATAYRLMYYDPGANSADVLQQQTGYVFDTNNYTYEFARMGRATSLVFWWQHNNLGEIHGLFGFGPGASRSDSTVATGSLANKYFWSLDTHAASALLWDVGFVGCLAFTAALLLAGLAGLRLARDTSLPQDVRIPAELAGLGLILIASTLPYTRAAIDNATVQFILFFFLVVVTKAPASRAAAVSRR